MKQWLVAIFFLVNLFFTACSNNSVEPVSDASRWKVSGEAVMYTQTGI